MRTIRNDQGREVVHPDDVAAAFAKVPPIDRDRLEEEIEELRRTHPPTENSPHVFNPPDREHRRGRR